MHFLPRKFAQFGKKLYLCIVIQNNHEFVQTLISSTTMQNNVIIPNYEVVTKSGKRIPCHNYATAQYYKGENDGSKIVSCRH